MPKLEKHIAPDEPVLWRTPTLRDWVVDHAKLLAWTAGVPVAVAVLLQNPESFAGSMVVPLVALAFAARGLLRGPTEALLTGRQLLFRRGIRQPEIRILERRDIARAEIFGGDGTLILYSRHSELHGTGMLGDPLELARELNVPTTHWKPYEPPRRVRWLDAFTIPMLPLASLGLASALVFALPDAFWEAVRSGLPEQPRITSAVAAIGIITAAGIPSFPAVAAVLGTFRRLVLPRDELNRMRCYKFNPLWRGENPGAAATGGLRAALRAARLGFDRLINGPFPDCAGIEPEQYQPGAFPAPDEDEEQDAPAPAR